MPYQVVRTIYLKDPKQPGKQFARNPGDLLSPEDLAEIPERVRDRQLSALVDGGKLRWIDSPEQQLKDAKAVVEAHEGAEATRKKIDDVLEKHVGPIEKTEEPKRRGRPPKK